MHLHGRWLTWGQVYIPERDGVFGLLPANTSREPQLPAPNASARTHTVHTLLGMANPGARRPKMERGTAGTAFSGNQILSVLGD